MPGMVFEKGRNSPLVFAKSLASMDFHEPSSFPLYKGISSRNIKKASKPLPGRHSGTTGTKYKLNGKDASGKGEPEKRTAGTALAV